MVQRETRPKHKCPCKACVVFFFFWGGEGIYKGNKLVNIMSEHARWVSWISLTTKKVGYFYLQKNGCCSWGN